MFVIGRTIEVGLLEASVHRPTPMIVIFVLCASILGLICPRPTLKPCATDSERQWIQELIVIFLLEKDLSEICNGHERSYFVQCLLTLSLLL